MKNRNLFGTTAACAVIAALALNSTAISGSMSANAQEAAETTAGLVDTGSAVAAANWSNDVTITVDEVAKTFRFQSNGIPSHGFAEKYLIPNNPNDQPFADKPASAFTVVNSAEYFKQTEVDTTITTRPTYVEDVTDTSLGRIGVALSGAQIFNDYENRERSVVAQDDQVIHDHVPFLDQCNGHTLANGTDYHYHGVPVCITEGLDSEDAHSVMIGILEDGFPVYGNHGQAGAIVTNADLDACSGHVDATPEFLGGIYHYHLTADEAPYMIDCYHGEIETSGPRGANGPDFAAIAEALGVSEEGLMQALGNSMPPDFDAAAQTLGISADDLRAAMPAPPQ
ncbi:MAG TPA: YHYH protein [Aurantimonas coralicida]|uniref:YHYH protein n=2 Tax=root TaxID=1 RepID=A0A9C9NFT3_9HYPH|nr:YHYH protein [Aurantimonas coralicida]HEU00861.1 YHYH protein [Aurantimonas coralicida]